MYIMCAVYNIHYNIYMYIYIYTACIQHILYIYILFMVSYGEPMRYDIIAINNVGTDTHKKHKLRKLGASG